MKKFLESFRLHCLQSPIEEGISIDNDDCSFPRFLPSNKNLAHKLCWSFVDECDSNFYFNRNFVEKLNERNLSLDKNTLFNDFFSTNEINIRGEETFGNVGSSGIINPCLLPSAEDSSKNKSLINLHSPRTRQKKNNPPGHNGGKTLRLDHKGSHRLETPEGPASERAITKGSFIYLPSLLKKDSGFQSSCLAAEVSHLVNSISHCGGAIEKPIPNCAGLSGGLQVELLDCRGSDGQGLRASYRRTQIKCLDTRRCIHSSINVLENNSNTVKYSLNVFRGNAELSYCADRNLFENCVNEVLCSGLRSICSPPTRSVKFALIQSTGTISDARGSLTTLEICLNTTSSRTPLLSVTIPPIPAARSVEANRRSRINRDPRALPKHKPNFPGLSSKPFDILSCVRHTIKRMLSFARTRFPKGQEDFLVGGRFSPSRQNQRSRGHQTPRRSHRNWNPPSIHNNLYNRNARTHSPVFGSGPEPVLAYTQEAYPATSNRPSVNGYLGRPSPRPIQEDPYVAIAARHPSVLVYDSAAVTSELHDPATAVLYYRPRHDPAQCGAGCASSGQNDPVNVRTALAGQLAGALTFTSSCFGPVRRIRLRKTAVAVNTQGRFVLMVLGRNVEWAEARLSTLSELVDASTGGLRQLWQQCSRDRDTFVSRLTLLMDDLVVKTFSDVSFRDYDPDAVSSTSSCVTSSATSPFSDTSTDAMSPSAGLTSTATRRRTAAMSPGIRGASDRREAAVEKLNPEVALAKLHALLGVAPCVQLPRSGLCGVFLRGQRALEACVQYQGVLAGLTLHAGRLLSSQLEGELTRVLSAFASPHSSLVAAAPSSTPSSGCQTPEADSLEEPPPPHPSSCSPLEALHLPYQLPHGVTLHTMHLQQLQLEGLIRQQQQCVLARPRERGPAGLHLESSSFDLTSLRNVLLQHQTLHNYPSTLPGVHDFSQPHHHEQQHPHQLHHPPHQHQVDQHSVSASFGDPDTHYHNSNVSWGMPPTLDPLQLCAKISRNNDLLNGDMRPSQSLPGSPRKIRVAAMLPDVGNNSPDLRYKVLNVKRPYKPGGVSSTNTPRRFNRGGLARKQYHDTPSRSTYPDTLDAYTDSRDTYTDSRDTYTDDRDTYIHSTPLSSLGSLPRRVNKLSPPSLSLSYDNNQDNKYTSQRISVEDSNHLDYANKFSQKGGSKSRFSVKSGDSGFEEMAKGDAELNLKNTKNKLNLQFAPENINRPQGIVGGDLAPIGGQGESKISQEINGNFSKVDPFALSAISKSQLLDDIRRMEEDDDSSRSGSEISVLELSSFIDTKESDKDSLAGVNDDQAPDLTVEKETEQEKEIADNNFSSSSSSNNTHHLSVRGVPYPSTETSNRECPSGPTVGTASDISPGTPSSNLPTFKKVVLYTHTIDKTCLCLLLHEQAAHDPKLVYTLWAVGQASLPALASQLHRCEEVTNHSQQSVATPGDCFVRRFGQTVSAVDPERLNLTAVERALQLLDRRPEVLEMTLRQRECALWVHRLSSSITLYQQVATCRPGPPIPSDAMAKLPHRARRRLERDHAITLL